MNKDIEIKLTDEKVDITIDQVTANVRTERKTIKPKETKQIVEPTNGKYFDQVTIDPIVAKSKTVKSSKNGIVTIEPDEGEYFKKIIVNKFELENKTIYPTTQKQVITSNKDGLESVTIEAAGSYLDADIKPENIRANVKIFDVTGTMGANSEIKYANADTKTVTVEPSEGVEFLKKVYINPVTKSIDANIRPENIKKGCTILSTEGQYEGDNKYQSKTVTPSTSQQIVTPDSGINFLDKVTVNAIAKEQIPNLTKENIKTGVQILDITGEFGGAKRQTKTVYPTTNYQEIKPDANYDVLEQVNIQPVTKNISPNITSSNIRKDVEILGVRGNLEGVNGEERTATPSVTERVITPSADKNAITKLTINPITYDLIPNLKSSIIKKDEVILGLVGTFEGASNLQEKTVNPTSVQQEITPDSDYDGLSKVTVNAVDTEIKEVTPSKYAQTINPSEGKLISKVEVSAISSDAEPNLIPSNVRENISIFGVTGTYSGGGGTQEYFGTITESYSSNKIPICSAILYIPVINVTTTNGQYMFYNCINLSRIEGINSPQLTTCSYMFFNCLSLTNIPPLSFTDGGKTATSMFYNCSSLTGTLDTTQMNLIASSFSSMFANCTNLSKIKCDLNPSNVNASNYTNCFQNCTADLEFGNNTQMQVGLFDNYKGKKIGEINCSRMNNINLFGQTMNVTDLGGFTNLGQGYTSNLTTWFNYLPKINKQSIINIFEKAYDMTTTSYTPTFKLKDTQLAMLSAEEIAIATAKGWTITGGA